MTFGEKVKALRNRKGLTQPALGKLIRGILAHNRFLRGGKIVSEGKRSL